MHVIARPALKRASERHPSAADWINAWWYVVAKARWENLHDVRKQYLSVDQVGRCLIFNVRGTSFRLIAKVSYANRWTSGTLLIKHFLTHAEYNKDHWKKDCCE